MLMFIFSHYKRVHFIMKKLFEIYKKRGSYFNKESKAKKPMTLTTQLNNTPIMFSLPPAAIIWHLSMDKSTFLGTWDSGRRL